MFFDPVYLIFAIPGLLLALWASFMTKSTFKKYSEIRSVKGLTGAEAAYRVLQHAGVDGVQIEEVSGFLSDHYDPMAKKLRLSPDVFNSNSLSAIGVACHEAGHAIQHAHGYIPLHLRSMMVPATNVSTWLSYIVITLGFVFQSSQFVLLGAIIFSAAVIFSIITLPVEWDASSRAKKLMVSAGIVAQNESGYAGRVLNAAFMTYVAAAVSSLLTLAYYLLRAGIFNRSDD
jgi:Zn-dependent membrane protease YugP